MCDFRFRSVGAGVVAALTAGTAASVPYTMTMLDPGPWLGPQATSINNNGHVVGTTYDLAGVVLSSVGLYWDGFASAPVATTGLHGFAKSSLLHVSDDGVAVGSAALTSTALPNAVVMMPPFSAGQQGTAVLLPTLLGDGRGFARAYARNDAGVIVGTASTVLDQQSPSEAVIWSDHNTITSIGTLDSGDTARATGVNNNGVVIGESNTATNRATSRGFVWTEGGGMREVASAVAGGISWLNDINNSDRLVGWTADADGASQAAFWNAPDAQPTLLRTLFDGQAESVVTAVNDSGVMVGDVFDDFGASTAVMWMDDQVIGLADLIDDPLIIVSRAIDINENGEILVFAFDSGTSQAFQAVLTPIPAPGSLAVVGALGAAAVRRRR